MTILITGGSGQVGANIARMMLEQDRKVVVMDRVPPPPHSVLAQVPDRFAFEMGTVTDYAKLLDVIKRHKVEGIIHCGAMPARLICDQHPIDALYTNVVGTGTVLEAARQAGLRRVIVMSTAAVMGAPEDLVTPVKEGDVTLPVLGIYRITKLTCEQLAYTYKQTFKLDTFAIRPRAVYGPGSLKNPKDGKAIKADVPIVEVVTAAAAGEPVSYKTGRDMWFECTYLKDFAQGIIQAYDCKNPRYYVYNLSFGQNRNMGQVADILRDLFPHQKIEIGPGLWEGAAKKGDSGSANSMTQKPPQDNTRALEDFGFKAEWDLGRAIPDWARWLKEAKY